MLRYVQEHVYSSPTAIRDLVRNRADLGDIVTLLGTRNSIGEYYFETHGILRHPLIALYSDVINAQMKMTPERFSEAVQTDSDTIALKIIKPLQRYEFTRCEPSKRLPINTSKITTIAACEMIRNGTLTISTGLHRRALAGPTTAKKTPRDFIISATKISDKVILNTAILTELGVKYSWKFIRDNEARFRFVGPLLPLVDYDFHVPPELVKHLSDSDRETIRHFKACEKLMMKDFASVLLQLSDEIPDELLKIIISFGIIDL